jgi:hypothetical protein
MLMGHPPQIIARGREHRPQGCCENLTPVQVPMVVQELVARDAEVQAALADTPEAVQTMAQAGPQACHGVAVHTRTVRVTTSLRAGAMVARTMVIVGLGAMVNVGRIGEARRPHFPLGGAKGCDGRGAPMLQPCQRDWRSRRVRVGLVTALPQAPQGWTTPLGGGSTATLQPALSRCTCAACDCTGQPCAARPLVARIRFPLVLSWACRVQMGRRVDAPIQPMDPTRRGPLLEVSRGGHGCGVQLPWPQAPHQPPCEGTHRALCADRTGPVRAQGTLLAQAHSAGHTVAALQSVVAPCARLHRIAATAWTLHASGPAPWSQIIRSVLVILQVWYEVLHRVAPMGCEQPHDTDTARVKL